MESKIQILENKLDKNTDGLAYPLTNPWIVWYQKPSAETNGKYEFYPVFKFSTIAGFWKSLTEIKLKKNNRLIFMREGIAPAWEHPVHTKGGYLAITINNRHKSKEVFIECLLALIGESLTNDTYESLDITGLTFINDIKFCQVRLWTKNGDKLFNTDSLSNEFYDTLIKKRIKVFNDIYFMKFQNLQQKTKRYVIPS